MTMFISVHSKEFNAPPIFVDDENVITDSEYRKNLIEVLHECLRSKIVFENESVSGFRKRTSNGIYFCCRIISQVTDTAGRRLPFFFYMKAGDKPENFKKSLALLQNFGYNFSQDEFDLVLQAFSRLDKKKGVWDFILSLLEKIWKFFAKG